MRSPAGRGWATRLAANCPPASTSCASRGSRDANRAPHGRLVETILDAIADASGQRRRPRAPRRCRDRRARILGRARRPGAAVPNAAARRGLRARCRQTRLRHDGIGRAVRFEYIESATFREMNFGRPGSGGQADRVRRDCAAARRIPSLPTIRHGADGWGGRRAAHLDLQRPEGGAGRRRRLPLPHAKMSEMKLSREIPNAESLVNWRLRMTGVSRQTKRAGPSTCGS